MFCELFSVFGMPSQVHSDRGKSFICSEFKQFMHSRGISTSYTTPYKSQGNSQVERLNGTIWKTIELALNDKNVPIKQWESVLPEVLYSLRSLISTATNETPHERLFRYQRRWTTGLSLPSWLLKPGPVLIRKHVRASKYDPLVEVANPHYANVRLSNGREI